MELIEILTIVASGGLFGNELAIAAFVHPSIDKLTEAAHAGSAKELASVLGRIMPFWYAAVLLLCGAEAWVHHDKLLVAAALVAAGSVVYTIAVLVPINNRIAALVPTQPYEGWLADRRSWDRHHRIRVGLLLAVFALVINAFMH